MNDKRYSYCYTQNIIILSFFSLWPHFNNFSLWLDSKENTFVNQKRNENCTMGDARLFAESMFVKETILI